MRLDHGESPRRTLDSADPSVLGKRVWLVLGGGGLKGLAHIGIWRGLVERGIRVQGIVGTSVGALVGALVSGGMSWEELRGHALALRREDLTRVNRWVVWVNGVRQVSVYKGEVLRRFLERLLPIGGWDALEIPVHINAVELGSGKTEWFGPGARMDVSLLDAVHASCSLPVIYPPVTLDGGAYVDGGAEHPLGLDRARELGATGIIGVDAGVGARADALKILNQGLVGIHQRIFAIMSWRRRQDLVAQWEGPPLLYVRPRLDGHDTFDFESIEYFVDEGYRAMREALEE